MPVHVRHPEGGWTVDVAMLERDRARAEAAAGVVPYALRSASALFDMIHVGKAGGWMDDTWLIAMSEVAAHSFRTMAESEGETLSHLHRALRLAEGQKSPTGEEAA